MALDYNQINAITEKYFVPTVADAVFDSDPLLKELRKKAKKVNGGEKIMQPVAYARTSSAGRYTGTGVLNTADNEQITAAAYDWKQYYANVTVSGLDEMKNSGPTAIVSLVKEKMNLAEKTLAYLLATDVFNAGTTANGMLGLAYICSTSNSPGGISQTDYSWWQAQVDSTTAVGTLGAFNAMFTDVSLNNERPDLIVSARNVYDILWDLIQPSQRFASEDMAKAGFSSLMFNGCKWVSDSYCTANYAYFLNTKYLHLYVHPKRDIKWDGFVKPTNQDLMTGKFYWMGALGTSNARMLGLMSAVAA